MRREQVIAGGGLPRLLEMLDKPAADVPFMQSAAAACLCNLAANPDSKITIAKVELPLAWCKLYGCATIQIAVLLYGRILCNVRLFADYFSF